MEAISKDATKELEPISAIKTNNEGEALAQLDPVKEAKMMRKFDVRKRHKIKIYQLLITVVVLRDWSLRYPLYAGKLGQVSIMKRGQTGDIAANGPLGAT